MAFKVYQFDGLPEVQHFLNGGITGKKFPSEGIRGLVGKSITFTNPSDTCTFTQGINGPDPDTLVWKDIKDQLETQVSGLKAVLLTDRVMGFILSTPTTAVALGATAQDARAVLGLARSGAIAGKVILPSTDAGTPRLDGVAGGPDTQFIIYVWE